MRDPRSSLPLDALNALQDGHVRYSYKGIPALKCPFDLALYALLIWNVKPRTIFEIGSNRGGSAIWLADKLRACAIDGHVWSFDVDRVADVSDALVTFRFGDAGRLGDVLRREELDALPRPFLVIEDSSHHRTHSLAVLDFFEPHMRPGEYVVVEDGIVTDLGLADGYDGGPGAAIAEFLGRHGASWEVDASYCDFFGRNVTWNPNGYLRKVG